MFDFFLFLYDSITNWFRVLFTDITEFLVELPVSIVDGILSSIAFIIESIPFPQFLQNNGLQTAMNAIPSEVIYFLVQSGFNNAMAVLSAGLAFRMLRKVLTIFQW